MIFVEHNGKIITKGRGQGTSLISSLHSIALDHPDEFIFISKQDIDIKSFIYQIKPLQSRCIIVSSYNPLNTEFGYVEDTPFIPTNNKFTCPTWKKGTAAFLIHSSLLNQVREQLPQTDDYLYWLNSLGKLTRPLGILNYQVPLLDNEEIFKTTALYRFVKQHYKRRWTLQLLLCHMWYENRFPLYAFAKAQFYKRRFLSLDMTSLQDPKEQLEKIPLDYDVIIPTIGRGEYLKDVLIDLNDQKISPAQVIIVEQNPDPKEVSDLPYVTSDEWKFKIIHKFTHTTGACGARNKAVKLATAQWALFFDDDVRVANDFMEKVASFIIKSKARCVTFACLQKNDVEAMKAYKQWESFGSGCSIVHKDIYSKCSFDMALEHGYGEDADYGMQVRNLGEDVIYAPQIQMLHLKAPVGGFRNPHAFPWKDEKIQPKPSPQIMYFRKKNFTVAQMKGYKVMQLFKSFGFFNTRNPIKHFKRFENAWVQSEKWAARL